jgi:hypothetical protein
MASYTTLLANQQSIAGPNTQQNPEGEVFYERPRPYRYCLGCDLFLCYGHELEPCHCHLHACRERLRYRIDIPKELQECLIPPMIIQPLVENAVIHGIWPKRAGGSIVVAARRIDSKLSISVQDDGMGFDCQDSCSNDCGIGLQNVRLRIKTLDPGNHLRVDSKRGTGTTVAFELPFEIAEKEFAFAFQ